MAKVVKVTEITVSHIAIPEIWDSSDIETVESLDVLLSERPELKGESEFLTEYEGEHEDDDMIPEELFDVYSRVVKGEY